MPIIEVGAPKLGMSGGGFIDPRQAVEDAIKNESEAGLLKAVSSVLGAVFSGTQKFEAKQRADTVDVAQAQINQHIGLVKQGYPKDKAVDYLVSGEWAPKGFQENQPKMFQRLMDAGVGRVDPAIVSYEHSKELDILRMRTTANRKNLTDLLEQTEVPEQASVIKDFMGGLTDEGRESIEPFVDSIVQSAAISRQVGDRARTRATVLDSASLRVTSHSIGLLDGFAKGTASFEGGDLDTFVNDHLAAAMSAGGTLKNMDSKAALEKHARKRLAWTHATLKGWADGEVSKQAQSEFVIKFNALQTAFEGVRMGSRGTIDSAHSTLQSVLSDPYWAPGVGKGNNQAAYANRESTRANYEEQARDLMESKKAAWANATEADIAWETAKQDILTNLPPEITGLLSEEDGIEQFVAEAMDWASKRSWNQKSGQAWLSSGDIKVDELVGVLAYAGNEQRKAAQKGAEAAASRELVRGAGAAGQRLLGSLLNDPDDPDATIGVSTSIAADVNVYTQFAETNPSKSDLSSYRQGVAAAYKTAIEESVPKLIASGQIVLPEGETVQQFLESIAMQMSEGLREISSTESIGTPAVTKAIANLSAMHDQHLQKTLGRRTPSSFLKAVAREIDDSVWEAVSQHQERQVTSGAVSRPFSLGGTALGRLRDAAEFRVEGGEEPGGVPIPADTLAGWQNLADGINRYEAGLRELVNNPGRVYQTGGDSDLKSAYLDRVGTASTSVAVKDAINLARGQLPSTTQSSAAWIAELDGAEISMGTDQDGNDVKVPLSRFISFSANQSSKALVTAVRSGNTSSAKNDVNDFLHSQRQSMRSRRTAGVVGGAGVAVSEVLPDRAAEEPGVLEHHPDVRPQLIARE